MSIHLSTKFYQDTSVSLCTRANMTYELNGWQTQSDELMCQIFDCCVHCRGITPPTTSMNHHRQSTNATQSHTIFNSLLLATAAAAAASFSDGKTNGNRCFTFSGTLQLHCKFTYYHKMLSVSVCNASVL